jgi:hypothetical protein
VFPNCPPPQLPASHNYSSQAKVTLQSHWITHSKYRCTTARVKSLLHTLPYRTACHYLLRVRVRLTLRLAVYRQSVRLGTKPLEDHEKKFYFQPNPCGHSPNVRSCLTRGWVRRLQLLMLLASVIILGSESRGTHDHILMLTIRTPPLQLSSRSRSLLPATSRHAHTWHRAFVFFLSLILLIDKWGVGLYIYWCSLMTPYSTWGYCLSPPRLSEVKVKVKVTLRLTISQLVSLGVEPHLGPMTRYLLLFDSYGLVFVLM